jgi:hypothetical protein
MQSNAKFMRKYYDSSLPKRESILLEKSETSDPIHPPLTVEVSQTKSKVTVIVWVTNNVLQSQRNPYAMSTYFATFDNKDDLSVKYDCYLFQTIDCGSLLEQSPFRALFILKSKNDSIQSALIDFQDCFQGNKRKALRLERRRMRKALTPYLGRDNPYTQYFF